MKIAAAYIRVSTEDQVEYSPESQRKAIIDYAKRNDYILPEEFIFADEGISGRSTKRPGFQSMISTAKQKPKPFDAILVWKFSRFARNREDSIVYKSMLRKQCGIDVISISEQIGEDKTSILIEALLEAMDEYYSINLGEEVVRGMSEKARQGGVLGGAPFGYIAHDKKLVPDPETAPILRQIFADYLSGIGCRTIARNLNAAGIPTRYGKPWENRTVEYVLRNITYIGKTHWTPGGTSGIHSAKIEESTIISHDTHEPLIDEDTFQRVQEKITTHKRTHIKYSHPTHGKSYMLKSLMRCSACGYALTYNTRALQCYRYAHGKCSTSHYISLAKINKIVIEQLQTDFQTGVFRFDTNVQPTPSSASAPDTSTLKKEIDRIKIKLQRAKDAYQSGVDTLAEYRDAKEKLTAQINELQAEIDKITPKKSEAECIAKLRETMQTGIAIIKSDAPEEFKNDVLKSFVSQIIFKRSTCTVEIHYRL